MQPFSASGIEALTTYLGTSPYESPYETYDQGLLQQLDKLNCIGNILNIKRQSSTQVVHSFVPKFARPDDAEFIYSELTKHNINFFPEQPQVDFARDGFHYDILTASNYATLYVNNLKI